MNILLDFIPLQHNGGFGGAFSYTKAVYDEICLKSSSSNKLFAVYNSSLPIGKQYNYQEYALQHNIQLLDLATSTLSQHIVKHNINTFFNGKHYLLGNASSRHRYAFDKNALYVDDVKTSDINQQNAYFTSAT